MLSNNNQRRGYLSGEGHWISGKGDKKEESSLTIFNLNLQELKVETNKQTNDHLARTKPW